MKSVEIRELQSSDYQSLAKFNSTFPGDTRNETEWLARFKYWWDENPAFDETWTRGFLLLDGDRIVGFVGSFPTLFKADDEIVKAFNGTTWRVCADYRKHSIDLWEKNREISKHFFSFNTTPTDNVVKLISKMGYYKYPIGEESFSYQIKDHCSFADSIPIHFPRILVRCAARFIKMYQSIVVNLTMTDYRVQNYISDKSELDRLWDKNSKLLKYTNVRTRTAVEWYGKGKLIHYVYEGKKLVAYAIYQLITNPYSSGKTMVMLDFWYDLSYDIVKIIVALVKHNQNSKNVTTISSVRYPHYSKGLAEAYRKVGLSYHKKISVGYLRLPNHSEQTISGSNSYFTLLQGDMGHSDV